MKSPRVLLPLLLLGLLALVPSRLLSKPVEGTIRHVDLATRQLQLETADATLLVSVSAGDAAIAVVGQRVRGDLIKQGDSSRLQSIWPADPDAEGTVRLLGDQLRRDTWQRGSAVFRNVGEPLPRFALYDQSGRLFLSESLKGYYAVVAFIFSRCTQANMCPATTERLGALDRLLDDAQQPDVKLLSITLDPAYDTPGIWAAYARDKGIDTSRHSLLTGPEPVVEALKQQMGVLAEADPELIVRHTISIALIGPDGTIIYRVPSASWSPDDFFTRIQQDRARRHPAP